MSSCRRREPPSMRRGLPERSAQEGRAPDQAAEEIREMDPCSLRSVGWGDTAYTPAIRASPHRGARPSRNRGVVPRGNITTSSGVPGPRPRADCPAGTASRQKLATRMYSSFTLVRDRARRRALRARRRKIALSRWNAASAARCFGVRARKRRLPVPSRFRSQPRCTPDPGRPRR